MSTTTTTKTATSLKASAIAEPGPVPAAKRHPYIGGVANNYTAAVGKAWDFPDPIFNGQVSYLLKFESTYEAIEKLILPPPLKVDRSRPPEVIVWFFTSGDSKGPGGHLIPFQGFQFRGYTEYNGVKGVSGWEYVDGLKGDKTYMDVMSGWGLQFGMLKKLSNIHFTPIGGNRFEITVDRNGQQLIRVTITQGAELSGEQLEQMQTGGHVLADPTFTVREMPSADWTHYVDRTINCVDTGKTCIIKRVWQASEGTIEFGNMEFDPLDELNPKNVMALGISEADVLKTTFTMMEVVGKF